MYYKLGQHCATNCGSFVFFYKLGQTLLQMGALQIRETAIKELGSYYELVQNILQIGTGITN